MTGISEEYLNGILAKIAANNNLQHWTYSQVKFDKVAQNYFGILIPVVLSGSRGSEEIEIKLVLKLAPTDELYRVSGAVTAMFAREIFVYSVILKAYEEMQEHFPPSSKYIIPHCYYFQKEYCKEVLVMQDMCGKGYMPYTEKMFLDWDSVLISLNSLAKLHALSFMLKNKKPDLYTEICETCKPLTEQSNKRYMDIMRDRLDKALDKFKDTEYVPLFEKLRFNCSKYFEQSVNSVKNTCICHGDIWKENILFKYKNGLTSSACMIDYQTTRLCSPAFDTMYLIISSTDSGLRKDNFYKMLDIYYQTFEQMLKGVGLVPDKIYSRQMFDHDVKVVSPACIITANTALWLSNGLQEEGHVRSKIVLNTQEDKDRAVNNYIKIVKGIIDDLVKFSVFSIDQL